MARVGWVDYVHTDPQGEVFTVWPAALDLPEATVTRRLEESYEWCLDTIPADALAAATTTDEATGVETVTPTVRMRSAQITYARYLEVRANAGDGTSYGTEEYAMPDTSRRLYLDAVGFLRPRRGLTGVF